MQNVFSSFMAQMHTSEVLGRPLEIQTLREITVPPSLSFCGRVLTSSYKTTSCYKQMRVSLITYRDSPLGDEAAFGGACGQWCSQSLR